MAIWSVTVVSGIETSIAATRFAALLSVWLRYTVRVPPDQLSDLLKYSATVLLLSVGFPLVEIVTELLLTLGAVLAGVAQTGFVSETAPALLKVPTSCHCPPFAFFFCRV